MNNFKLTLKSYKKKHKIDSFEMSLRRFKRKYLTSAKKKEEEYRRFHEELSKCFKVEPAVYYQDQPH